MTETTNHPTYESTTERVKAWLDGSTLHIRFNNPARHNALSVDMWEAVPPLLRVAREDGRVRLVVFSGEGTRPSCPGRISRNSRTCARPRKPSSATRPWPKSR
ncbi:hypothetical protein ACFQOZ_03180 [Comamonas endophytica]|uniref:hypothetical protein n=1 Tax=Comamonas endophytica TaxID=2949090 RepID=UPI003622F84E